ncbi:ADP-ribosylglycohydrolase family protein [Mesorhizobium sp. M0491]|uniref:ADP-ribosylglycohydrolase family protein n=1 Tax=Mesorhizobium sp. M0491 TaxID=2956950 RepID=UPI00333BB2F6
MTLYDHIYGCLLGGACGDALGAPVEFLKLEEITARYGSQGILDFDAAYGVTGAITDDTQMTLFTVDGLIRAAIRMSEKGIGHPPAVVHHAYKRWLVTQDQPFEQLSSDDELDGWLIREKRLWTRRAPGNTCLSALRESRSFGSAANNNSKGCGTVMRDASFGFFAVDNPHHAFSLAMETARTTHGHPSAAFSSGALAAIIAFVAQGEPLPHAVEQALSILQSEHDAREVQDALRHAAQLSSATDWRDRLSELGEGWVAEEALAIAVLCALAAEDPREAIIAAVNHSGDSDSTGAIAGNVVGALHGPRSLPTAWVERVELGDVIETLARDFAAIIEGRYETETFWDRYPGW